MLKNIVKILSISLMLTLGTNSLAADDGCDKVRSQCETIIHAFEREIELKDLMVEQADHTIKLVEKQRDAAYVLAEHNPSLYNKAMLGIMGVGVGCAAMAEDATIRLVCLAASMVTCALGGC